MNRWLALLLLAVPAAIIARALHASPLLIFVLAALGIVPLAGLIGQSTEVLAEHLGQGIGGLLNATFGNAAEIIIGLTALAAGPSSFCTMAILFRSISFETYRIYLESRWLVFR